MPTLNLISWNVNGLRACANKGFMEFFSTINADIFCIQESKMQPEQKSQLFKRQKQEIGFDLQESKYEECWHNYTEIWHSADKKGYSGTIMLSKIKPLSVRYEMNDFHKDSLAKHSRGNEGRIITAEFEKFYLVNVYVPNSKRELEGLDYRMAWEDDFRAFLKDLERKKPVIICGDLNVAHNEIDLANPKTNCTKRDKNGEILLDENGEIKFKGNAGFSDWEREKFSALLDCGFVDTFRHFYPDLKGAYSWWSYFGKARENNVGWRIDYFLCSKSLESALKNAKIYNDFKAYPQILGSDHCPVGLEIEI